MDALAVADALEELADLLEVDGADPFRLRAYRVAATTLRGLGDDTARIVAEGRLARVPGIGEELAPLVEEGLKEGRLHDLAVARDSVGMDVRALRRVPGLGPARLVTLRDELGVRTLDDLEAAVENGRLARTAGIGPALTRRIKESIPLVRDSLHSLRLDEAFDLAGRLRRMNPTMELVGDARRFEPQVRELVFVGMLDPAQATQALVGVGAHGIRSDGATVTASWRGLPIRFVRLDPTREGKRVIELTGTAQHVKNLKSFGAARGIKWKDVEGDEAAVYAAHGLQAVAPELRVGQEEVEQATAGALDRIVTLDAIRGDLQMHTTHSDGSADVLTMARAAAAMGYEYIGITDHVGTLPVANALTGARIEAFLQDVAEANDADTGVRVLAGAEVDVDREGALTVPDEALEGFDYVAAGIHVGLDLAPERQTERYVRALEHPLVRMLVHPTGRKVNARAPVRIDLDRVLDVAIENQVVLETNGSPHRLDLDAPHLRRVLGRDGIIATNTDAHHPDDLHHMLFAVMTARRGWAKPEQVINTWPVDKVLEHLGPH